MPRMSSSKSLAAEWVKFFIAAGVPTNSVASYAHIFVENRIKMDMLMDINKDYLQEMGIVLMGDIISILRHAKFVNEQTAREKVMATETPLPVAKVVAHPIVPEEKSSKISLNSSNVISSTNEVIPLPKTPRRVLPEHEGKYKVKLPSGTTERSKEILAKKAMLYADKEASAKPRIFERLASNTSIPMEDLTISKPNKKKPIIDQEVRITGLGGNLSTSSIFSRLGGKYEPDVEFVSEEAQIKPILKKTSKISTGKSGGITKAKSQKVLLVKKVPIKKESDSSRDSQDIDLTMDPSVDKIVSFASEAEVREFATRMTPNKPLNRLQGMHADRIHKTAKLPKLKTSPVQFKLNTKKIRAIRMKSDDMFRQDKSIHNRLGLVTQGRTVTKITNRRSKPLLSANHEAKEKKKNSKNKTGSVFERLGFTF